MVSLGKATARSWSILVTIAAVGVAGCGQRTVDVQGSVIRLRLDEFRISPAKLQVRPGRLKIVAYNVGTLTHIVRVEESYLDSNGNPIVLGGTSVARPGDVVTAKIALSPGTYKLVDTIANHAALGEYSTLTVK